MKFRKAWTPARVAFGACAVLILLASPATARSGVSLATTIGGKAAAGSSNSHPVTLSPRATEIDVRVTNTGASPVQVATVRLSSSVLGLNFFDFETSVALNVAPGTSEELRFSLDLSSLKGQATGLLPASISLLDANRHDLASQSATVDVHGSKISIYGIFGLVLLVLTALALVEAILALAHHGLSPNRFARGLRFLLPGIGLGLVLVIGSSVLGLFAPRLSLWGPVVLITALVLFAVGFLSPSPETDEELPPYVEPERTVPVSSVASRYGASATTPAPRTTPAPPPPARTPAPSPPVRPPAVSSPPTQPLRPAPSRTPPPPPPRTPTAPPTPAPPAPPTPPPAAPAPPTPSPPTPAPPTPPPAPATTQPSPPPPVPPASPSSPPPPAPPASPSSPPPPAPPASPSSPPPPAPPASPSSPPPPRPASPTLPPGTMPPRPGAPTLPPGTTAPTTMPPRPAPPTRPPE